MMGAGPAVNPQEFMDTWEEESPEDTAELSRRARIDALRDQVAAGNRLLSDEFHNAYDEANNDQDIE